MTDKTSIKDEALVPGREPGTWKVAGLSGKTEMFINLYIYKALSIVPVML